MKNLPTTILRMWKFSVTWTKERVKNEPGLKVPEAYDIESEVSKDPIDHLGLDTQKFVHQLSMISNGHYMT